MGASHESSKISFLKHSDRFISLTALPEKEILVGEIVISSIEVLNRWAQDLKKLNQMFPEHLLLPSRYKIAERSLCGQSLKIEIEYPCFQILLSEQLSKRREEQKYLQEPQMWYLVYCLVQSAKYCHQLNGPIGDIRPQNILLSQAGKLKILSAWSLPAREGLMLDPKKKPLCSPEQLQCLRKSFKQFDLPFISCESFSIGMTILSAGTLQSLAQCYDYQTCKINQLEFNKILNFWFQNEFYSEEQKKKVSYSRQLKDIVLGMVEVDPEKRMKSLQIYNLLQPHRNSIMNLKSFQLNLSRSSSPKKNSLNKESNYSSEKSDHNFHILKSKKKSSQKGSVEKSSANNSKIEVSNFLSHLNNQYSFNSPPTFNAGYVFPSPQKHISVRRNKLLTSSVLMKQQHESFK